MKYLNPFFLFILLMGCSSPIASFEGDISYIESNLLIVDCSSAVNKDGNYETIGYLCNVNVTADTLITNKSGKQISINDLTIGQEVQIVLKEKAAINESKDSRDVTAEEIIILD